jgi:hypothetical protein
MLEEAHVGELDLRHHPPTAELAGGRDGEFDEQRPETPEAVRREDREAIALPQGVRVERVEADGAGDVTVAEPDGVQRLGGGVAIVAVVAGEERLGLDEDVMPHGKVRGQVGGVARQPAGGRTPVPRASRPGRRPA